jgi:hypothetical protein
LEILGREAVLELTAREAPRIDSLASVLQGEMAGLRKTLDVSNPDSEIRRVNRLAGSMSLPVSKTISQILILSRRVYDASDGALISRWSPICRSGDSGAARCRIRRRWSCWTPRAVCWA